MQVIHPSAPQNRDIPRISPDKPLRTPPAWTTYRPLRRFVALLALGIGLIASLLAGLQVKHDIKKDATAAFAQTCDEITLKIRERLTAYTVLLEGGKALFSASQEVTRDEWRAYVETLHASDMVPGYQGIGFALLIKPEELEAHERKIRAEGFPNYYVRPAGPREIYGPIVFIEPFSGRNLRAFGYDMLSESVRRKAMERACDTGEAALSGKVTLMQEDGHDVQAGTLMYVPLYRKGAPVGTTAERRAAIMGWVYSPYRMDDLIKGTIPSLAGSGSEVLDLEIFDSDTPTPEALLFDSQTEGKLHGKRSLLHQERTIGFSGHNWLLVFNGDPDPSLNFLPAWVTAAGGLLITALVFGMLLSLYKRSDAQLATEELAEQVRGMAFHDALTHLPNRVLLRDRLDMALASAKRTGQSGAVMMVDLDNFKPLNDEHGHAAGDNLLIEVAQRLRACVRETDTIARLGGDEFIVLLNALSNNADAAAAEALAVAEKICRSLAEPYHIAPDKNGSPPIEHRCSSSIGLVLFSGDNNDQSEIIRNADHAMYRAKKEGRNRVCTNERA